MRGGRTSGTEIFIRAYIVVFLISMVLAELWNWTTETRFWSPVEIAIASLMIVVFYGGFAWLVTNVGTRLIFRKDPDFHRYIRSGGDPYLDILPKPLNPDSQITRETGLQEPKTDFMPPKNWIYQCPVCGARQPSRIGVCWNCNYGADGDSSAYYERFGNRSDS